jgi:signal transduction histidine kinase
MAEIYANHQLPLPASGGQYPPLYYLLQILPLAASIKGYTLGGDVLDAIANAYAQTEQYELAFRFTQKANLARESTHSLVAKNRAIAMQVRYQIERATAHSEYHQQLAIAEAKRVAVLAETNAILAKLGAVGQEITAQLQTDGVFAALSRNVHGLLDVCTFAVYLLTPDGKYLDMAFGIENGQALLPQRIGRDDPYSNAARSWRECTDILFHPALAADDPSFVPGTVFSLSRLFAPLMIGNRILGVMSVQSAQRYAYGASERFIFRTLCAYGAIALENSCAYQQLEMAQAQVVEQEKLAALGRLVAGVAHELNTPIGNCLIMSTDMHQKAEVMDERMLQRTIKHRDLVEFLDETDYSVMLVIRGLTHAADLVNSFKHVAVDRTAAHRRIFNLQQTCHDVVATMMNQIKLAGHQVELDIPATIELDSYPGSLGQVLSNFISNALTHAFPAEFHGQMRITAKMVQEDRVWLSFSDNGIGIPEAHLKRIFDPFFAGKKGSNGLGLSISYNIVTSLLNGKILVSSQLGDGTRFTLDLPLTAYAVSEGR